MHIKMLDTNFLEKYLRVLFWWDQDDSEFKKIIQSEQFVSTWIGVNPIIYGEMLYSLQSIIKQKERNTESAQEKHEFLAQRIQFLENKNIELFSINRKTAQIFAEIKYIYKILGGPRSELKKHNHDIWIIASCLENNCVLYTYDKMMQKISEYYNNKSKKYWELEFYSC